MEAITMFKYLMREAILSNEIVLLAPSKSLTDFSREEETIIRFH